MAFSKQPLVTESRIMYAVDQARRVARESGCPVYSFFIDGHFYNVFDTIPDKTDDPKSQYAIKGVKRCFSDLYYHYPECYIGCYESIKPTVGLNGDRKKTMEIIRWMIDDFTYATQESIYED